MTIYLPGDELPIPMGADNEWKESLIIGSGISRTENCLTANQAGFLRSKEQSHNRCFWIESHCRRYVPVRGDKLIGIVTGKAGDAFKVDLGAADIATIFFLSFEGATKRNKPAIKNGDLIYCQVLLATKDMEPELVCVDSEGKARGMGQLPDGGFVFKCSLSLVRRLLSPESTLLLKLGQHLRFEIACGMNGRIWIKSNSHRETVAIVDTIIESEFFNDIDIAHLIRTTLDNVQ